MPYQNISAALTDATWLSLQQKCDEMQALLPFLVNLSKTEKRKGLKLGKKSEKFFFDILKLTDLSPQYVPAYININEYNKDFDLFLNLQRLEVRLKQLIEAVADTRVAAGQECMGPALAIYQNVKNATRSNAPGSDSSMNDLKPYFKKERKKKKP